MATKAAARAAPEVVVVDSSATGADRGAAEASPTTGRAADGPPDIVATDKAVCDPGAACDTANSASTMATLLSATKSAGGISV